MKHQADAPAHPRIRYVLSITVAVFLTPESKAYYHAHCAHTRFSSACKASSEQQAANTKNASKQSQPRRQQEQRRTSAQSRPPTVRRLNDWSDGPSAAAIQKSAVAPANQQELSILQQPKLQQAAAGQQQRAMRMSRVELQAILIRLQSGNSHTCLSNGHQSVQIVTDEGHSLFCCCSLYRDFTCSH
jgi:hypothetical protein